MKGQKSKLKEGHRCSSCAKIRAKWTWNKTGQMSGNYHYQSSCPAATDRHVCKFTHMWVCVVVHSTHGQNEHQLDRTQTEKSRLKWTVEYLKKPLNHKQKLENRLSKTNLFHFSTFVCENLRHNLSWMETKGRLRNCLQNSAPDPFLSFIHSQNERTKLKSSEWNYLPRPILRLSLQKRPLSERKKWHQRDLEPLWAQGWHLQQSSAEPGAWINSVATLSDPGPKTTMEDRGSNKRRENFANWIVFCNCPHCCCNEMVDVLTLIQSSIFHQITSNGVSNLLANETGTSSPGSIKRLLPLFSWPLLPNELDAPCLGVLRGRLELRRNMEFRKRVKHIYFEWLAYFTLYPVWQRERERKDTTTPLGFNFVGTRK